MRRWLSWTALVLVFSVACGFLANWQFNRREARVQSIELVKSNYSREPIALEDSLRAGRFDLPNYTWRPILIQGSYLSSKLLLVRNRPNNGQPGFEQLVPFRTVDGETVFVSRGWLPTGEVQDSPDTNPPPIEGLVEIKARILKAEPRLERTAPAGQLASINIELANENLQTFAIENGYLRLDSENGKPPFGLKKMPSPSIDEGNNLSYALQWILFALMASFALVWRIRKDRALATGQTQTKKTSRTQIDEEIEDSITTAR